MITIKHNRNVNFIDSNDNFVGWDDNSQCCESHDYDVYSDALCRYEVPLDELYVCSFDPKVQPYLMDVPDDEYDYRELCVFTLTNDFTGDRRFLAVSNAHNGYYAHDYEYSIGEHKGRGSL